RFYFLGEDQAFLSVPVTSTSDSELAFTTPDLAPYLEPQDDGLNRAKVELRLEYDSVNGDPVRSAPQRWDFQPPGIQELSAVTSDSDGTSHVTVTGTLLADVDVVRVRVEGPDPYRDASAVVIDDHPLDVTIPPLGEHMRRQPDGTWAVGVELRVGYLSAS